MLVLTNHDAFVQVLFKQFRSSTIELPLSGHLTFTVVTLHLEDGIHQMLHTNETENPSLHSIVYHQTGLPGYTHFNPFSQLDTTPIHTE